MKKLLAILAATQVISWGSGYYAIAVLAPAISADLGSSGVWVMGAFSLALLVSGLAAPRVGRLLDRHGGRKVMAAGSVAAAAGYAAIASAGSLPLFYAGWTLLGLAMALTLYEAAFATIHQAADAGARQAISTLTLFGGFASTVFLPLSHLLEVHAGWRGAFAVFALLQLFVCLPLHLQLPRVHVFRPAAAGTDLAGLPGAALPFWLIASAFAFSSFVFSATSAHIVTLFTSFGHGTTAAVGFAAMIGPMQVGGRLAERVFGGNYAASAIGSLALGCLPIAMAILLAGGAHAPAIIAFCILYGASNGVLTVVRGALPRELYGRDNYGAMAGRMAAPGLAMKALGPVAATALVAGGGSVHAFAWVLLMLAVAAWVLFMAAAHRRGTQPRFRRQAPGH